MSSLAVLVTGYSGTTKIRNKNKDKSDNKYLNTFDEISAIAIQCRNNKSEVRYSKESSLQTEKCTLCPL